MSNDLNKKLAEWAGFTYTDIYNGLKQVWYPPGKPKKKDGTYMTADQPPDFTNDLNACFKWLVSKCRSVMVYEQGKPEVHNVVAEVYLGMSSGHFAGDTTPAEALSKAIEQLMNKKGAQGDKI